MMDIGISPLAGKIYIGHLTKDGKGWRIGKVDVTDRAIGLVCENVMARGGVVTVTAGGEPAFQIEVKKLGGA